MNPIRAFLWFDGQAEQAANHYVALFPGSKIGKIARYGEAGPATPGSVMVVEFELNGQPFAALNGGPAFSFTEAVSFVIECQDQAEVDRYWDGLLAGGGKPVQCGWLKDRFGLSWQVVPLALREMMADPDPAKVERVTEQMLKMVKLDLAPLRAAFDGA